MKTPFIASGVMTAFLLLPYGTAAADLPVGKATAQSSTPPQATIAGKPRPTDTLLALSGGASRGAYQAGVLHALSTYFRAAHAATLSPTSPLAPFSSGQFLGVSGVSMGGVNALITAATLCQTEGEQSVDNNPFWDFWQDMSWARLFPGDASCREYAERFADVDLQCDGPNASPYARGDVIFSTTGLQPLRQRLLRLITQHGKLLPDCRVPVSVLLTIDDPGAFPVQFAVNKLSLPTSRRYTAFELRTVGQGDNQRMVVCDVPAPTGDADRALFIGLPRTGPAPSLDGCDELDLSAVLDATVASASLAPLLPPRAVAYCGTSCEPAESRGLYCPAGTHLCESRFSDGVLFNQQPVSGAVRLLDANAARQSDGGHRLQHLVIDARNLRNNDAPPSVPHARGYLHLSRQIDNFFAVAGDLELQMLSRYRPQLFSGADFSKTTHYAPITGDLEVFDDMPLAGAFLKGMSAFFDINFRRHDFYLGIYDGMRWLAEQAAAHCAAGGCDDRTTWTWIQWLEKIEELVHLGASPRGAFFLNQAGAKEIDCDNKMSATLRNNIKGNLAGTFQVPIRTLKQQWQSDEKFQSLAEDPKTEPAARLAAVWFAMQSVSEADQFGSFITSVSRSKAFSQNTPYIENHDQWRWKTMRQILRRMELAEHADGNDTMGTALAFTQYVAAIQASRRARGWDAGPVTIPDRFDGGSRTSALLTKLVLPSLVATDWSHGGIKGGWDLLSFSRGRFRLVAIGAQAAWQRYPVNKGEEFSYAYTPSASLNRSSWNFSDIGLRPALVYTPERTTGHTLSFGGEAFMRLFQGRAEVSVGWRDLLCSGNSGGTGLRCADALTVNLGIADFSGLIYWTARALTGDDEFYAGLGMQAIKR